MIGAWLGLLQSLPLKAQIMESRKWIGASSLGVAIGAPYILFMWGTPEDMVIGVTMTMGLFGLSAGMAFWLLWRYWVSPEKYTRTAISISQVI
jgi:hypothetical protein